MLFPRRDKTIVFYSRKVDSKQFRICNTEQLQIMLQALNISDKVVLDDG